MQLDPLTTSLSQAVVLFMVGEYDDATSRIENLCNSTFFESSFIIVQACE